MIPTIFRVLPFIFLVEGLVSVSLVVCLNELIFFISGGAEHTGKLSGFTGKRFIALLSSLYLFSLLWFFIFFRHTSVWLFFNLFMPSF